MSISQILNNPIVLDELKLAINGGTGEALSFDAPLLLTGDVVSLPIAGVYSATNNVVKGSSATALEWGSDSNTTLTFDAPLDLTSNVVTLPIAGTWSGSNNYLTGSSATALEWGSGGGGSNTYQVLSFDSVGSGNPTQTNDNVNILLSGSFPIALQIGDLVSMGLTVNFQQISGTFPSAITANTILNQDGYPVDAGCGYSSGGIGTGQIIGLCSNMYFKIVDAGAYSFEISYTTDIGLECVLDIVNYQGWYKVERGTGV